MAKHNIDYAFKSYVLNSHSDLVQKVKRSTLVDFAIKELIDNGVVMPILFEVKNGDVLDSNDLCKECRCNNLEREFKECLKINQASFKRVQRLRLRIETMLRSGNCIFLTLTFTDETLTNTTFKQRRVAVARYLKQFNCPYVANIDFGKENHREHYHAIIQCDSVDYSKWNYGAINGEKIRNKDISTDIIKLSKYVSKLTNHAIKETTKRSALIYSR